ncbi:putative 2-aminoethylphosphonate ABC transporter substrate-binding protein [Marinobacterium nitratireducens]|uniref:2-aminoethylphosphonate ABC transporter substrate-binding protein n=1 Tax=Marinobacterium nitratireducens TaxID=518897 RepID=A0A917Z803_9GAMM|nr:putative 2-aminoethylphosphonate ABC transporter substrate-binding protein [Marinobacterium nitratireducens]GGO75419.1 putative 2-aminoethylphosphonate ABC transporter substrate-binding protein [Marinobacterium nitratireducens]
MKVSLAIPEKTGNKKYAAALLAALASLSASAEQAELTVYTALEANDLKKYADRFNEDHPDIKINWVRDSTGIITAKLLAEKENPRADVIWGLAGTSLLVLSDQGMLQPYAPVGVEKLAKGFRDANDPPAWTGMDAWVAALCVNRYEMEKNGLPVPKSWKDLLDPVYKGHVIMPNPASSGTGYLDVSSWLQLFGEDEGWKYMDGLHANISRYTHSGSKPCKLAATGETAIGVSYAYRAAKLKNQGAPLDVVVPEEGVGWELEASAIVKGTHNLDAAKKLMDWSVSLRANELYNEGYAVVALPGVAKPVAHFPPEVTERMIENDFSWAAANRARILEQWSSRYDAKSEAE